MKTTSLTISAFLFLATPGNAMAFEARPKHAGYSIERLEEGYRASITHTEFSAEAIQWTAAADVAVAPFTAETSSSAK